MNETLVAHRQRVVRADEQLAEMSDTLIPFRGRTLGARRELEEINDTLVPFRARTFKANDELSELNKTLIPFRARSHRARESVEELGTSLSQLEQIVRLLGASAGNSRLEILARQNPLALLGLGGDNPFATIASGGLSEDLLIKLATKPRELPPRGRGLPRLQAGGLIEKTGVAVVHRGERVVPAGTPPVTINFSPTIHAGGSRAAQDVALVTRRLVRTELIPAIEQALRKNTGGLRTAIRTI